MNTPIPAAIATKVAEIMASSQARFGHGELFMELKDETDTNLALSMDDIRGKTPEELENMLKLLDAHLRSIHQTDEGELREKTEAEQAAFDLGMQVRDAIFVKLENHRAIAEVFRKRPESVKQVMANIRHGYEDGHAAGVIRMTRPEARDRALRILDSREASSHMTDAQKTEVDRLVRRSTDIARRVIVTENDAYREAWTKLVTDPNAQLMLDEDERAAMRAWGEYRAMSEGTTTAGGFGVPVFIDPSIILTAQESDNPFLRIATQKDVNTNAWKGVSSDGVSWSFDAEASEVSDDSPSLLQPNVPVFTARGFIPYSIEVGEDYPGFASEMSTLLAAGYDELLVDKFTRGSGSGEPLGIVTALDADTTVEVQLGTAGTLAASDIYNVWAKLPQKYRRRASWLGAVEINNKIRQLGTANNFHATTVQLSAGAAEVLMNKSWYETPYMTDLTSTAHTNVTVVGDFSNYVIARRGGMSVELIQNLVGSNHRPTAQRGWFAHARIGGGTSTNKGFRILNQT